MHKSPEWLFVEPGGNKCSCGKILHPWRLWYDRCKYALGTCVCLHLSAAISDVDLTLQHCRFSHHLFLCLIHSQPVSCLFSSCAVGPNKCICHNFFIINVCIANLTLICWRLTAVDMNISSVICGFQPNRQNKMSALCVSASHRLNLYFSNSSYQRFYSRLKFRLPLHSQELNLSSGGDGTALAWEPGETAANHQTSGYF